MTNGRGRYFDDLELGMTFVSPGRTVTETDVVQFAGLSGDYNQLHTDEEFARKTPFRKRIAHGMLINSMATGLAHTTGVFEGTTVALVEVNIRYQDPVYFGDTIHLELEVLEKDAGTSRRRGLVKFRTDVRNQSGNQVIDGYWRVMMRKRIGESA